MTNNLLDVSIAGTGTLGELTAGTVQGSTITNDNPADSSPPIATISLTGRTTPTSIFLANNRVQITEMNGLGTISTDIDTVSVTNTTTTISGPSLLSRFLTGDIDIPACRIGSPQSALDLAMQLSGEIRGSNVYNEGSSKNTKIYTMFGHGIGFDSSGRIVKPSGDAVWQSIVRGGQPILYQYSKQYAPPVFGSGTTADPSIGPIYSSPVYNQVSLRLPVGVNFLQSGIPTDHAAIFNFIFYKNSLPSDDYGDPAGVATFGNWQSDLLPDTAGFIYERSNDRFRIFQESIVYPPDDVEDFIDVSGLSGDEWLVSLRFHWDNMLGNLTMTMNISETDGSNKVGATIVHASYGDIPNLFWTYLPSMRMVRTDWIDSTWTGWDEPYEIPTSANVTVSTDMVGEPIAGMTGNLWDYLNQVCSFYDVELALVDDVITLRDRGISTLETTNHIQAPVLNPVSNKSEYVSIEWLKADNTPSNYLYYEVQDSYSVDVGEEQEITIETSNEITYLLQPQPRPVQDMLPPSRLDGYSISGSDNLPINPQEWLDWGGSLEVSTTDVYGQIRLVLKGPREEIPGVPAPYSFVANDGETSHPLIRLKYAGVAFTPQTTTVATGAGKQVGTKQEPVSFTNVGVTSESSVWGCVARGAKRFAGPQTTVTFSIPVTDVNGFGLVEGSLFEYKNCVYRIVSADYSISTVSITAMPYNSYTTFEGRWSSGTYADFESLWADDEYTFEDFSLAPLTTEW